jgi:hypothetical protein
MSQGTLVIPTTGILSGLQLVNAINAAIDSLVTNASGSTDPSTLVGGVQPYSFWLDTSVSPNVLRMRNAANTAWAAMGTISGNNFVPNLENADIATALGYTPVNKAGDTMSGDLTAPNVFGSTKVQAPEIKATTKIVFPDNSEQTTAATTAFPSGTVMLFVQSSAPTGWTKSTAHNDKTLRVVSGSVSSGGSVAFSTAFASRSVTGSVSIGATTLSTAQMPSHAHTVPIYNDSVGGPFAFSNQTGIISNQSTSSVGGGGSHNHSASFSGDAINMAVQYVDVIICTRN